MTDNQTINRRKSAAEIPAFLRQPFFVKKHDAAGYLHYDFRLGWDRVLLSWALPEGLSYCPGDSRKAVEVEDHRREYGAFEGLHKSGTIMLWDRGMWEPHPECSDVNACLRNGVLKFTLYGEKLKGGWTLARSIGNEKSRQKPIWILSKNPDPFARSKEARSILEEEPNSASTKKTMEEIARDWKQGNRMRNLGPKLF